MVQAGVGVALAPSLVFQHVQLAVIGLGVTGLFELWPMPAGLGPVFLGVVVVLFVVLVRMVAVLRSFQSPRSQVWTSRGWLHTSGILMVVALARAQYEWTSFESCSISERAIALRLPGKAGQFVLIGRSQFQGDDEWRTATELVDQSVHSTQAETP